MSKGTTARILRSVVGLTLLASFGAACGSDDEDSDTTTEATDAPAATEAPAATDAPAASEGEAGGSEFVIEGFEFPEGFTAAAGEAITVINNDGSPHTVTSDDFNVAVEGGAEASLTVDAPGTYEIHCNVHPQMQGTITID